MSSRGISMFGLIGMQRQKITIKPCPFDLELRLCALARDKHLLSGKWECFASSKENLVSENSLFSTCTVTL